MAHSNDTQRQCGTVWIGTAHSMPSNLPHLVAQGALTAEQAARVDVQDVRAGDPECMVYAAFGLRPSQVNFSWAPGRRLVGIQWDYRCDDASPVP